MRHRRTFELGLRAGALLLGLAFVLGLMGVLRIAPHRLEWLGYGALLTSVAAIPAVAARLRAAPWPQRLLLALVPLLFIGGQFQDKAAWFPLMRWDMYCSRFAKEEVVYLRCDAVRQDGRREELKWCCLHSPYFGFAAQRLSVLQEKLAKSPAPEARARLQTLLRWLGDEANRRLAANPIVRVEASWAKAPLAAAHDNHAWTCVKVTDAEVASPLR